MLATTVTDGAGRYVLGPLAAGRVTVTFQLEGFSTAAVRVAIGAEVDAVANQRLVVAPQSETVTVVGRVPAPRPLPPPPAAPRAPTEAGDDVRAGTRSGFDLRSGETRRPPESFGTIRSRRYAANALYAKGDELVVDGGTLTGLEVGRNFVVRRTFRVEWDPHTEIGEHTAGLVQIVSADESRRSPS